ncbi:MAG: hypothetical protein WC511_03180 [Candidatus Pacearchaeota archaeon]
MTYVHSLGVLKGPLVKKYRSILQNKEYEIREISEENIRDLQAGSLFGSVAFLINFQTYSEEFLKKMMDTYADGDNKCLICMSAEEFKKVKENSKEFAKELNPIFEVEKDKENFKSVCQYVLQKELGCAEGDFNNYPVFKVAIEDLYFNHTENILDFFSNFHFISNICIQQTGEKIDFDLSLFRKILPEIRKKEYYKAHILLGTFIKYPNKDTLAPLFSFVSAVVKDATMIRYALDTIYRTTFELLQLHPSFEGAKHNFSEFKVKQLSGVANIPLVNTFQFMVRFSEMEVVFNKRNFLLNFHNFLMDLLKVIR